MGWAAWGAAAVLVCAPGCAPDRDRPACAATCGVRFDGGDCPGFQAALDYAVEVYSQHVTDACARLDGFDVYVLPTEDGTWKDEWGRKVAGLTWCWTKGIELGSEAWDQNALAHELAHALECPSENLSHEGWEAWQWDAVQRARPPPD